MANYYILAYHDQSNTLRLFPEVLHVQQQDTVIWASNVNEQYAAGQFSSPQLFPDSSYEMPANDQSSPAPVQNVPPAAYLYTCTGTTGAATNGDFVPGIIIVDPPGVPIPNAGNGKGHRHQPKVAKKKGR